MAKVIIEDHLHAETQGEFADMAQAVAELKRRAGIPWDHVPNVAPCSSWRTCGREYAIIEYDDEERELRRTLAFKVSAIGVTWAINETS